MLFGIYIVDTPKLNCTTYTSDLRCTLLPPDSPAGHLNTVIIMISIQFDLFWGHGLDTL